MECGNKERRLDMKRLKIVSVGGGWVVNNRHILALKQSGLFDVIGVISSEADRVAATAHRHQIANTALAVDFSSGWQQEADAVMIGAIPHVHYEIAKQALLAGKHVLTEKPMTIDPAHAGELKDIALSKKLTLAVVHNFQYGRASMAMRKHLAEGRLGQVKTVYGVQLCNHQRNIPAWCDKLPLGLFFDEAPHFYYMLRWLSGGDLTFLNASVWKGPEGRNTPRMVSGQYRAAGNFPVMLHINFDSSITEWQIVVVGDKSTSVIDLWRDIYINLPNDGVHTAKDITMTSVLATAQHWMGVVTGGARYAMGKHLYGNVDIVTRFWKAVQGEDSLQGMNPDEGRRVVEMMHELIQKAVYF